MSATLDENFKSSMQAMVAREMRHPPIKLRDLMAAGQCFKADVCLAELGEMPVSCSLDQLYDATEMDALKFVPGFSEMSRKSNTNIPKAAMRLETLQELMILQESGRSNNPFIRTPYSFKMVQLPDPKAEHPDCKQIVNNGELLITIRVYRPVRTTHKRNIHESPMFAEEFQCLGSNLLTELRDKIACVCNGQRFFDVSEDPFSAPVPKETEPSFFFINDTFYNDKRNPENADYSETVRMWAKTAAGINASLNTAKMEETRFIDLTVSMGFPQVYQHHGRCEHIFVFSKVEVITASEECLQRKHYPVRTSFSFFNTRACQVCGQTERSFIVRNSNRLPDDPAYMCTRCFLAFHYVDGKKVGNFQAYRLMAVGDNSEMEDCTEEVDSSVRQRTRPTGATDASDANIEFVVDWGK